VFATWSDTASAPQLVWDVGADGLLVHSIAVTDAVPEHGVESKQAELGLSPLETAATALSVYVAASSDLRVPATAGAFAGSHRPSARGGLHPWQRRWRASTRKTTMLIAAPRGIELCDSALSGCAPSEPWHARHAVRLRAVGLRPVAAAGALAEQEQQQQHLRSKSTCGARAAAAAAGAPAPAAAQQQQHQHQHSSSSSSSAGAAAASEIILPLKGRFYFIHRLRLIPKCGFLSLFYNAIPKLGDSPKKATLRRAGRAAGLKRETSKCCSRAAGSVQQQCSSSAAVEPPAFAAFAAFRLGAGVAPPAARG
jgi:hypothetical protein